MVEKTVAFEGWEAGLIEETAREGGRTFSDVARRLAVSALEDAADLAAYREALRSDDGTRFTAAEVLARAMAEDDGAGGPSAAPGLREQVDALMFTRLTVMPELEGPLADICPGGGPVTMALGALLGAESMELSRDPDRCCLVGRDVMGELPRLLARPALVGRPTRGRDRLEVVLPAMDGFCNPLIVGLMPAREGGLEVGDFGSRAVRQVYGGTGFYRYFGAGIRPERVLYVGSASERELASLLRPELDVLGLDGPFGMLSELPRDRVLGQWRPGEKGGE